MSPFSRQFLAEEPEPRKWWIEDVSETGPEKTAFRATPPTNVVNIQVYLHVQTVLGKKKKKKGRASLFIEFADNKI